MALSINLHRHGYFRQVVPSLSSHKSRRPNKPPEKGKGTHGMRKRE